MEGDRLTKAYIFADDDFKGAMDLRMTLNLKKDMDVTE